MNYYDEDDCGADTMEELFHGRDVHEADFEEMNMPAFGARGEEDDFDLDQDIDRDLDEDDDEDEFDNQWGERYAYGFGE